MLRQRIFFTFIGLFFMISIYSKVNKKIFSESESFFWMFGGIVVLFLSIFPGVIKKLSILVGIEYGPSLLFLISILFLLFIVFRQSQQISVLNERVKELAQISALIQEKYNTEKNYDLSTNNVKGSIHEAKRNHEDFAIK